MIAATIAEFSTGLPSPRPQIHGQLRQIIDTCFAENSPLSILGNLEKVQKETSNEALKTWAEKTIKTIRERSPIAVAVTARQMRVAQEWDIAQTFQKEHQIADVFMHHPDFVEGVTARLIERKKTRPEWAPNQLEDVKEEDVAEFFKTRKNLESLVFLESGPNARYQEYPHKYLALPTEKEILEVWNNGGAQPEKVVEHFMTQRNGKVGIREKVEEVLERQGL